MNAAPVQELDSLLNRPDVLDHAEQDQLQTLILADPDAMERYLAMTELEVLLERDESIRETLLGPESLGNVVPMPGIRLESPPKRVAVTAAAEAQNGHPFPKWAAVAAAVVIATGSLAWWATQSGAANGAAMIAPALADACEAGDPSMAGLESRVLLASNCYTCHAPD